MNGEVELVVKKELRYTWSIQFEFDGTKQSGVFMASMFAQSIKRCPGVQSCKAELLDEIEIPEEEINGC